MAGQVKTQYGVAWPSVPFAIALVPSGVTCPQGCSGPVADASLRMHTNTSKVNSSLRNKLWGSSRCTYNGVGYLHRIFQEGHGAAGGMGSPDSLISTAIELFLITIFLPLSAPCIGHNYLPCKG